MANVIIEDDDEQAWATKPEEAEARGNIYGDGGSGGGGAIERWYLGEGGSRTCMVLTDLFGIDAFNVVEHSGTSGRTSKAGNMIPDLNCLCRRHNKSLTKLKLANPHGGEPLVVQTDCQIHKYLDEQRRQYPDKKDDELYNGQVYEANFFLIADLEGREYKGKFYGKGDIFLVAAKKKQAEALRKLNEKLLSRTPHGFYGAVVDIVRTGKQAAAIGDNWTLNEAVPRGVDPIAHIEAYMRERGFWDGEGECPYTSGIRLKDAKGVPSAAKFIMSLMHTPVPDVAIDAQGRVTQDWSAFHEKWHLFGHVSAPSGASRQQRQDEPQGRPNFDSDEPIPF